MSSESPVIVWFRRDLRLADNPALSAAAAMGRAVVPVYILDDASAGPWRYGGAARWWLHHSLASLDEDLRAAGASLLLRRGRADKVLADLAGETGADAVYWNRCSEPWAAALDGAATTALAAAGATARSFNGTLLAEPGAVRTKSGGPYKVFTAFWRALRECVPDAPPLPAPRLPRATVTIAGDRLDRWGLLPRAPDWAAGLRETWTAGESAARSRLDGFLAGPLAAYPQDRDVPQRAGTSRLSPHLCWGEIGPRQVWCAAAATRARGGAAGDGARALQRQLAWREFNHHLLAHFPELPDANWKPSFDQFPWRADPASLTAWQRGRTGYPLVDAGMRELWHTGWMHNRVRMIAASFLVKHLLIDWRAGAAWFWDTLVDADLANNTANWQWVAGSGADAAPYFRIFNPARQGARFDPEGAYVRRWVPELRDLPKRWVHEPWRAPAGALAEAGVVLGRHYPAPIVDHAVARERALAAYGQIKSRKPR